MCDSSFHSQLATFQDECQMLYFRSMMLCWTDEQYIHQARERINLNTSNNEINYFHFTEKINFWESSRILLDATRAR